MINRSKILRIQGKQIPTQLIRCEGVLKPDVKFIFNEVIPIQENKKPSEFISLGYTS